MRRQQTSASDAASSDGVQTPRRCWGDVILGIITIPTVVLFYLETLSFRKMDWEPLGMAFWPQVVLVGLGILGLCIAINGLWGSPRDNERLRSASLVPWIGGLLFLAALPWLGASLAGFILIAALSWLLSPERSYRSASVALANAMVSLFLVHLIFGLLLGLRIPDGRFGF